MKKLATVAAVLTLSASAALAGGYSAPMVEAEPIVVEEVQLVQRGPHRSGASAAGRDRGCVVGFLIRSTDLKNSAKAGCECIRPLCF